MRPFHLFRSVQPTARRTSAIGQRTRIRCNNSWNNSSVDGPQFCKPYSQAMRYGIGKSNPPRKHYGDPFRSAGERISISANILDALEGVAGWRGANLDAFCCCRCSPSQAALRYMFPPAVANLSNLQPQTNWHGKNVFIESGRKCCEEGKVLLQAAQQRTDIRTFRALQSAGTQLIEPSLKHLCLQNCSGVCFKIE